MTNKWIQALQKYSNKTGRYVVPKKGTAEYNEVMKIYNNKISGKGIGASIQRELMNAQERERDDIIRVQAEARRRPAIEYNPEISEIKPQLEEIVRKLNGFKLPDPHLNAKRNLVSTAIYNQISSVDVDSLYRNFKTVYINRKFINPNELELVRRYTELKMRQVDRAEIDVISEEKKEFLRSYGIRIDADN